MSAYRIHISRDNLMFAAGHFASYDGGQVEPLHGHNYRLGVTLEGPIEQNAYVFNFVTLKRIMKRLTDEFDHHMLLPRNNPLVQVEEQADGGVIVRANGRWYRFPREDVVLLDLPNTTVEMMARHMCGRLRAELAARADAAHLTAIEVALEESFGQTAFYREELA
ncbi:MAG: 6-carboxytetrahydropterin synthase [Kouleothrix sp.]|jgi:6-pyruvoyltetrahydropterin/6-carboxytetrahydropterin synthase|nr:6-carboxytetrahydropterin synthase [Kouleothrix sp.]